MKAFKTRIFHILILVCLLAALPLPTSSVRALGSIIYVKWDAAGSNNGASWADAYTSLQSALADAASGDKIWVAAGAYKPTTITDRDATFQLKSGVALYGGFDGTETKRDQRDSNPATNGTILSGDIATVGDKSDNSYHVVTGSGTDNTAVLDGFTVTGGNGAGSGGGMYNRGGSPTLRNLTFSGNSAVWGAGMHNSHNSSPTLTNVTFHNNTAGAHGGGVYNSDSSPTLVNVTFSGNSADYGGGMENGNSSPTLTNTTFSGNSADYGGGMYNDDSSPTLTHVTFSINSAGTHGGGMYNWNASSPKVRNTILWDNTAPTGAQVYNDGSTPFIRYSVVQDGCPADSSCLSLVTTDPLLGTLDHYGGSTLMFSLQVGSSAINAGSDTYCPATDQRGVTRPKGLHCDIGAFEFRSYPPGLLSPPDEEALLHKRPAFEWWDNPDATNYKIQASKSSAFDVLDINVNVTDSTYTPDSDLSANKQYFWRVKMQVNDVWSDWSEPWSFKTGKPSSIPVLVSPVDGTVFKRDYMPTLDWENSTVPAGREFDFYHMQVASDAEFVGLVENTTTAAGNVADSSYTPDADLPANDTYYWRVRAYNLDGDYSSWSTVWSFRTALEAPLLVFPFEGAVSTSRRPFLDWSNVSEATGYKVVVSRHSDFSEPLLNVVVTESIYRDTDWDFDLPANKLIYWRVKALGDNPSAWTSGSFTTGP